MSPPRVGAPEASGPNARGMNRTFFLVLATAGVPWVQAPGAETPAVWTVSVTPAVVTQYMYRGVRDGGCSFQPTVEADCGNLGVGVWANQPLADKVPGVSDPEIDPYVYYTLNLSDAVSLQPELYVYTYVRAPLDRGAYHATVEPNLALNYTWHAVKFTPKLYYDLVLQGPTCELNAAAAVALPGLGTELDFNATAGSFHLGNVVNDAIPKVKNWGDYWLLGVSVPVTLSKAAKLNVGFAYTQGSGNYYKQGSAPKWVNPAAVGRGVVSLSCAFTF